MNDWNYPYEDLRHTADTARQDAENDVAEVVAGIVDEFCAEWDTFDAAARWINGGRLA
jgi:hypothetical protein